MKILVLVSLMLLSVAASSQQLVNEIHYFDESHCDAYFPICFKRESGSYNVLINQDHWYFQLYKFKKKEIHELCQEMIDNLEKLSKSSTDILVKDQCRNYIMYIEYFYAKIDIKNTKRIRRI